MIKIYKVNKEHPNILDQLNKKQSCGTVLVYSDSCPHCTSMKPQWEQMKKKLQNKPANIYEINSNDLPYINHPIKNIIDGFPMILNVNNRNITPFNEERTLDNFVKFAESNILNMKPQKSLTNKKKVTFQNNNNNNYENKIDDSLNLDDYIMKKLPFLKVNKKSKGKTKKSTRKTKKSTRKTKKSKKGKRSVNKKTDKRKGKKKSKK